MSKKEIAACACLLTGFVSLVTGMAMINPAVAAIVGGGTLMAFGLILDKAAS